MVGEYIYIDYRILLNSTYLTSSTIEDSKEYNNFNGLQFSMDWNIKKIIRDGIASLVVLSHNDYIGITNLVYGFSFKDFVFY